MSPRVRRECLHQCRKTGKGWRCERCGVRLKILSGVDLDRLEAALAVAAQKRATP